MLKKLLRFPKFRVGNEQPDRFFERTKCFETSQRILTHENLTAPKSIDVEKLNINYLPDNHELDSNVPTLKHGLDQFLNEELVFGDQGVGRLPQQSEADSNEVLAKITKYVEPSEDKQLMSKATEMKCRYVSSTSSISDCLIVLSYIFSSFRQPEMANILDSINLKSNKWMASFRKPITFYLHNLENGSQAIVADKGVMPTDNKVLLNLGHVVEYFLTHEKYETDRLMQGLDVPIPNNYYRYAAVNDELLLRSQIDCKGFDQNGKPYVFEIKSRACAPIRYDVANYKDYLDYEMNARRGFYQSFEREYYDLIRGGFLKYAMQVKIGRMDGAFIAYHNTEKIYGYEYVKLKEMTYRVMGDEYNFDVLFVCVSKMLTIVLDHIRKQLVQFKDHSLKIGFYAEYQTKKLQVFVEPMTNIKKYSQIEQKTEKIQTSYDYYTHHTQIANPVYKLQFDFHIYLNGNRLVNPEVLLTPSDTLEIKYQATPYLHATLSEYLTFLYEANKEEDVFKSFIYKGMWHRVGDYLSSDLES